MNLRDYFETTFSDKSYAYRRDKSTLRAINRTSQFIQEKKYWILKTDIDNFFETINHDTLLKILDKQISDKRIIKLISLFIQTGGFKSFDYVEHLDGVHQGDILSPLLSNIYLDLMDKFIFPYVQNENNYPNIFLSAKDTKRLADIEADMKDFVLRKRDEWLTKGNIDQEWNDYLKQLKAFGLDEWLEIKQRNYDEYSKG